ncbi:MAG: tetratricopeptide repeat protein [Cyanobacteria bacterium SBLK]|nr:tetratricopeptide repeat protein [Cyanobacteria bacterium SBLK]
MRRVSIVLAVTTIAILGINTGTLWGKPNISGIARAQSIEERKAEADRLLQQGTQQYKRNQFHEALQSCENALEIYRAIGDRSREGKVLGNLGIIYGSIGEYEKAIDYQQQSLAIAQEIGDPSGEGNSLNNLGSIYGLIGEYEKAIEYQQQSLAIQREIGDRSREGTSLGNLGVIYRAIGEYEKAIDYQQQSLAIAQEIGDPSGEGTSLHNLGIIYRAIGEYEKAIDYQQQSLAIAQEIGDRSGEGTSLGNLGSIYQLIGEYEKAIDYQQQSLAIAQEIGDPSGESTSLGNLGSIYRAIGEYEKAIDYQQQSLAIAQEIGDRSGEGTSLGNLGSIYRAIGEYEKAIDYQQQSLAIAQEIGDPSGESASLGNLGSIYQLIGEYEKAIDYQQQSLAIKREIGDPSGESASLGNLGNIYQLIGEYEKAIDYQQQSLAIRREIGDPSGEGTSLGNLGVIYRAIGEYEKAIDYQQQSLAIAQEIGDPSGEGTSLNNLGNIYQLIGEYEKAIDYQQQSLAIKRKIGNPSGESASLNNLGNIYQLIGEYEKAIDYQQQSLAIQREIGDPSGEGISLNNLGNIYQLIGEYEKAIDYQQQSLAIRREIGDRSGEGKTLGNLGVTLLDLDYFAEAEQQLLAAAEVYESIRADLGDNDVNKISIFEQQATTYQLLQKALIAQNKTARALEASERGRARAFIELLYRRLNPDNPNPQIDSPNLAQIQQIAKEQNATLVEYSIVVDSFDLDDKPGKESTKESALYIWVVSPTGEVTFQSVDLTSLWKNENLTLWQLVQTTRNSIGVRGFDRRTLNVRLASNASRLSEEESLQKLHQLLIEPIADLLPTNPEERVIFIPQRSLFLAPFPALKDKNGKYLIEKHTILTAPSIQTLQLTRDQKHPRQTWQDKPLIVGNPTMPSIPKNFGAEPSPLASLPGAEREAKAIANLLDAQPLIGEDATKSEVLARMQNASLIHLATHSLLDDIRGIGSSIALAPDRDFTPKIGETNGLLTADEIFDLDLQADLVVLSACDTGRGRITGDGVVGLSRSLISAGIPSVLVSLWQVPDAPTAELMSEFYQQLEKNPDKAQALRQAMLMTLQTHPTPKNWAAFTLIGEAF